MNDSPAPKPKHPDALTIAPSLDLVLESAQAPAQSSLVDRRVLRLCAISVVLGIMATFIAVALIHLIDFFTNLFFFGRLSFADASPADNNLGPWVIGVPVIGGLVIGVMARYGSKAIRGHGIPEAMEQVLVNQSRIPARLTFLKPLSSAISIGAGGPFGAEGPIIATGGALGSVIGQLLRTTPAERKTLLSAGAAAGMSATFGSPVSAVLLAIELLLFEFRPRSLIPVALASATAAGMRIILEGNSADFAMPNINEPVGAALAVYILLGALMGVAAAGVTRAVYAVEDAFEKLPIHWMWWPSLGAVAVGVIGWFAPRTLGVGYSNITDILSDQLTIQTVIVLCSLKFLSWVIALGSGTSGGTLAPLFTIGGGLGAVLGAGADWLFPQIGVDVRIAALVGMAALFAGASRALLASVVFAFEITLQPLGLLPLLGGCTASYLVSCLLMRNTIMTEKIARRGVQTTQEYSADLLEQVSVRDVAAKGVVLLKADESVAAVRERIASGDPDYSHQGYPVVNEKGIPIGVLTRRDILAPTIEPTSRLRNLITKPLRFVYSDCTVRQAADHMVNHGIGRLPVVERERPDKVSGIITRSDVLSVYHRRLDEVRPTAPTIPLRSLWLGRARPKTPTASASSEKAPSENTPVKP